jgi:hypothetical protein
MCRRTDSQFSHENSQIGRAILDGDADGKNMHTYASGIAKLRALEVGAELKRKVGFFSRFAPLSQLGTFLPMS